MASRRVLTGLIVLMTVALIGAAPGPCPNCPCWGSGGANYESEKEITLKGTVEKVMTETCGRGGRTGTHLMVRGDGKVVEVAIGPSWFLSENEMTIAKGDAIEILGAKMMRGEEEFLMAREIQVGDRKLKLRDEKGFPEWAGSGRRKGAR
jgi:hypothetical protein